MDAALKDVEGHLAVLGRECGSRAVEVRLRGLGRWKREGGREGRARGELVAWTRGGMLSIRPSFRLRKKSGDTEERETSANEVPLSGPIRSNPLRTALATRRPAELHPRRGAPAAHARLAPARGQGARRLATAAPVPGPGPRRRAAVPRRSENPPRGAAAETAR